MSGCSIRALWILNTQDAVVFSKRFPVVEKRWRASWKREDESAGSTPQPLLPDDAELSAAFAARKRREGSARGFGIRVGQSAQGSDSWIDDPITRHIITLRINRDEGDEFSLWPLVLHIKGGYCIIVLPLVEPQHYKSYERMCSRSDCGNLIGLEDSLSSLLLELPCITGYAHSWSLMLSGI